MAFKGVIFDLDGTLLDTLRDLAGAANQTLESFGFPQHPMDAYRYFVGEGLQTLTKRIVPDSAQGASEIEAVMTKFSEIYREMWNKTTAPYDGIPEMLNAFVEAGLQLSVLSNKPHEFTKVCVASYFPNIPFARVYGNREGVPRKPDPAGALAIAEDLQMTVAEIVYVGDTATDMKTGNGAGMKTIGVEWGFREREELLANNAWKIAATPAEVLHYAL